MPDACGLLGTEVEPDCVDRIEPLTAHVFHTALRSPSGDAVRLDHEHGVSLHEAARVVTEYLVGYVQARLEPFVVGIGAQLLLVGGQGTPSPVSQQLVSRCGNNCFSPVSTDRTVA